VAVLTALYSERLKAWSDPIDVTIEKIEAINSDTDQDKIYGAVYMHHLRVRNLTPHRALQNCRVWLEHVFDEIGVGILSKPRDLPYHA
jgi:hypothetical protein